MLGCDAFNGVVRRGAELLDGVRDGDASLSMGLYGRRGMLQKILLSRMQIKVDLFEFEFFCREFR